MQINLRKAAAILAEIKPTHPLVSIVVPPHTSHVQSRLAKVESEQLEAFLSAVNLTTVERIIRELVQDANYRCGVNALVTQLAATKKLLTLTETLASAPPQDAEATAYALEANAKSTYSSHVCAGVFSSGHIEDAKSSVLELKREIRRIKDELLVLNTSNTIELPEDVVSVLHTSGII